MFAKVFEHLSANRPLDPTNRDISNSGGFNRGIHSRQQRRQVLCVAWSGECRHELQSGQRRLGVIASSNRGGHQRGDTAKTVADTEYHDIRVQCLMRAPGGSGQIGTFIPANKRAAMITITMALGIR